MLVRWSCLARDTICSRAFHDDLRPGNLFISVLYPVLLDRMAHVYQTKMADRKEGKKPVNFSLIKNKVRRSKVYHQEKARKSKEKIERRKKRKREESSLDGEVNGFTSGVCLVVGKVVPSPFPLWTTLNHR